MLEECGIGHFEEAGELGGSVDAVVACFGGFIFFAKGLARARAGLEGGDLDREAMLRGFAGEPCDEFLAVVDWLAASVFPALASLVPDDAFDGGVGEE